MSGQDGETYTSGASMSSKTENIENVTRSLECHRMILHQSAETLDQFPALRDEIKKVYDADRHSEMKDQSAKQLIMDMEEDYPKPENQVWTKSKLEQYLPAHRSVPTTKRNAEDEIKYIAAWFKDDGLKMVPETKWVTGCLPKNPDYDSSLGIKDPKPDFTFGLEPRKPINMTSLPTKQVELLMNICRGIDHPFMVIENKGAEESFAWAAIQALRDGTAMENAQLELERLAGEEHKVGALKSFVFSCAWDVDIARFYVHWIEKPATGRLIFHMNKLGTFNMDEKHKLKEFRRHGHNIMDWGVSEADNGHKKRCRDLEAKATATEKSKQTTNTPSKGSKASKPPSTPKTPRNQKS
ncbi:uncharacterized protein KY384_005073 [Bacidia gigantensis]|uniref:uncharacterized protein n=1 Tax=Bacidia gigantensis TaxID=2732470 RepID=UPI001D05166F|nr:uncharacterized protein KY384_005073 [Bacidia gigantensis]KAG8530570.1 hypothetical protein KY384_005073 [Bacidia gigantensis]